MNTNETMEEFTIPEILEAFRVFDETYKREEIDAAVMKKEEITPHLIRILENVLADPETYVEDDMLQDHIYAVMLLGHFKEPKAHNVIIDLFSLPHDMPDKLFGDITTSDLPVILLNTCSGAVESIRSMILNRAADDYCRISACQALAYAVVEGFVSRNEVISFFNTLFTGEEADEVSDFWGFVASSMCDLYPEESIDLIKQAYDDGMINPGLIEFRHFTDALNSGKDKCLEKLKANLERYSLDDIHARMSWWSCFNKKPEFFTSSNHQLPVYPVQSSGKSQKNQKKVKKKKRKQAKTSKKKNRR